MFGQRTAAFTRESEQSQKRAEALFRAEALDLHEMSIGARQPIEQVISEIFAILDQIGDAGTTLELPPAPSANPQGPVSAPARA
jgi:hypothetical protein